MKGQFTNGARLGSIALGFGLVATASAFFGGPGAAATSTVLLTPPP